MTKLLVLFSLLAVLQLKANGNQLPPIEGWSLNEAISYAVKNNIELQRGEYQLMREEIDLKEKKMNYIPIVEGSLNHSINWGRSVNLQDLEIVQNRVSHNSSISLSTSLLLYDGGRRGGEIELSKGLVKEADHNLSSIRKRVTIDVTKAFMELLLAEEMLSNAKESLKRGEEMSVKEKKLVDAGRATEGSLLQLKGELARDKVELIEAKNRVREAEIELLYLLNLPQESHFKISEEERERLIKNHAIFREREYSYRELSSPAIDVAQQRYSNAKINLLREKKEQFPIITLSAAYGTYYSDIGDMKFGEQFKANRNPSLIFSLSLPIFKTHIRKCNIAKAKLNIEEAKLALIEERELFEREYREVVRRVANYWEEYREAKESLAWQEESFREVEKRVENQLSSISDYSIAKSTLYQAKCKVAIAKYRYLFHLKIVDLYSGSIKF